MSEQIKPNGVVEYLAPGQRLPAITHCAYEALLKVYGVAHAEEFMRWLVVDVCGETWQEPPATPPTGEGG